MKLTTLLLAAIMPFTLISCEEKTETLTTESSDLKFVLLKEEPTDPIDIHELRTQKKAGDKVTFKGKIMGKRIVFIDKRAALILGDPSQMTICEDESCGVPWHPCCDDPATVKANIVTVQVLDKDGKLIKAGLKGLDGIKELSDLVITGEVDKTSNKKTMTINATGIYVKNK